MSDLFDDTSVTSMIRHLVGESTAKHWTDAEITIYKNAAMVNLGAEYWYMLFPMYKTYEDSTMTSGTNTITIPTDAQPNTVCVTVKETGRKLYHIQEDQMFKFADWDDGTPLAWTWKGGDIWMVPTPDTTTANYFRVWYMEHRNAVTDFPEQMRPLIAMEAAILARTKDENIDPGLLMLRNTTRDTIRIALAVSTIQEPTIIGDYEQADAYNLLDEEG